MDKATVTVQAKYLKQLVEAVLDDDYGINEQAYHHLCNLIYTLPADDIKEITPILDRVGCSDGRYYLKEI